MPKHVLLIQDDVTDAAAIRDTLGIAGEGSFEVEWVRSCSEAVERLTSNYEPDQRQPHRISAVLVDLALSDSFGLDTFDRLFRAAPQIPMLVLSAAADEESAKVAIQRGAQDYLLKERIDSYSLPKALTGMIERAANAEALFEEKERAQVTLNSIGDAVVSTDAACCVTYLNLVAERMTGWSRQEAAGRPLEDVLRIIDGATRHTADNPIAHAIRENKTVGLTPNCILVRRDGLESAIEDSAAPIHDRTGHVTGAVMVFHDVSAVRAQSQRMAHLAQHDSLTDLSNRVLLNDRLTQAVAFARRNQNRVAVLFLDVDRFKNINDSLGHPIGDRLLQSVAHRLLGCVRSSDTVSRQGGDEFVILMSPVTNVQDAAAGAEKILLALRAPHRIDQHELHMTASIGIATYPDDGTDANTLIKHADLAMYHAKDSGRDNCKFFRAEMNVRAVHQRSIESGLRDALDRQAFVLHYQPTINLVTHAITGVEALVRWRHPQGGLVLPDEFVPLAEDSGVIVPIGQWVLREACRQQKAWQDAGLPATRIAVNVSAVELRAKDFVGGVRAVLAATGLEPRLLVLELTETALLHDTESTAAVLRVLKDLGVQIALDDFGTGFSSLSHLRRFPIDVLKIDQSFMHDLTPNSDDANIVGGVIRMADSLQMQVVAEGVETSQQLAFLEDQRCPEAQGYYFSRPMLAEDITALLLRGQCQRRA
jgi:diguanylate cyclase (GGDEF)-like protein/PAS domain S-box-containing protein